ncbi:rod-binding protein [Thioclava sp. F28-4]|uniref:rod-binding protein n=1 Tax=Thioclava sp. F28-4 TaxID=1915315 RepID=UPI00267D3831
MVLTTSVCVEATIAAGTYRFFTPDWQSAENYLQLESSMHSPTVSPLPHAAGLSSHDAKLLEQAKALEAGFLSEMLKEVGMKTASGAFGGGIGEEQFTSFLRAEQSKAMVDAGGIGLAEVIFESLKNGGQDV